MGPGADPKQTRGQLLSPLKAACAGVANHTMVLQTSISPQHSVPPGYHGAEPPALHRPASPPNLRSGPPSPHSISPILPWTRLHLLIVCCFQPHVGEEPHPNWHWDLLSSMDPDHHPTMELSPLGYGVSIGCGEHSHRKGPPGALHAPGQCRDTAAGPPAPTGPWPARRASQSAVEETCQNNLHVTPVPITMPPPPSRHHPLLYHHPLSLLYCPPPP